MGDTAEIPRLVVLNGAPAVGKSTLGRRYCDVHPLMLFVDPDELRRSIGGWQEHEQAVALARTLGFALVRTHLTAGHDVVLAQFAIRDSFFSELAAVGEETGAEVREVVLLDDPSVIVERFRLRRMERTVAGAGDVAGDIDNDKVGEVVAWAATELRSMVSRRPQVRSLHLAPDIDVSLARLCSLLD